MFSDMKSFNVHTHTHTHTLTHTMYMYNVYYRTIKDKNKYHFIFT